MFYTPLNLNCIYGCIRVFIELAKLKEEPEDTNQASKDKPGANPADPAKSDATPKSVTHSTPGPKPK